MIAPAGKLDVANFDDVGARLGKRVRELAVGAETFGVIDEVQFASVGSIQVQARVER